MSRGASSAVLSLVTILVAILGVDNKAATRETTTAQKWAVLVGINDYGDMKKLSYCRNDAEETMISLDSVYRQLHTCRATLKLLLVDLSRNNLQTPMLWGKTTGNFDLGAIAPAQLPQEITNSIGMKLKLIPAGEFMMGSPEDEKDRHDNEKQHRVRITKPYYLGIHEVTQGQFEEVMGTSPWKGQKNVKEGADYAAVYVCCDDAMEFCSPTHD